MLTRREKEIMHLVILGLTSGEISKILFISETTVISHKVNIQKKLNAKNSCHAVFLFIKQQVNEGKILIS
jgi:DNA-binding CsgD family transcriptional regulator